MKKKKKLSESQENYLEVILDLETTRKVARAKDIADKTGVKRGSVTSALKTLNEKKLINYEPYSFVTLTPEGKKIAKEIQLRHTVLKDFLHNILQIDESKAEEAACRMEHTIDMQILERMVDFFDFIYNCPRTGKDWLQAFMEQCGAETPDADACEQCLQKTGRS